MNSEKTQAKKAPEASKQKGEEKKSAPVTDKSASKPQGQDRPRPRRDDKEPRDDKDRRGPRQPAARREGQPPREAHGTKPAAPAPGTSRATAQAKHVSPGSTWNKNSGLSFADMVRQKRDNKPSAVTPAVEGKKASPPGKRAAEAPAPADPAAAEPSTAPSAATPTAAREAPAAVATAAPAEVPAVAQVTVTDTPPSAPAAHAPTAPPAAAPAPAASTYYVLEMDRLETAVQLPPHVVKAAGMNMDVYRFSATPGAAPKPPVQQTMSVASQQAVYSQNAANLPTSQRWMTPAAGGADARGLPTQQSQAWLNESLFHNQWGGSGADRGIPTQRFPTQYGGASPFDIAQGAAGSNANFLSYRTGRPNGGDSVAMRQIPSQQQQQVKPQSQFVRAPFQNSNGVW